MYPQKLSNYGNPLSKSQSLQLTVNKNPSKYSVHLAKHNYQEYKVVTNLDELSLLINRANLGKTSQTALIIKKRLVDLSFLFVNQKDNSIGM